MEINWPELIIGAVLGFGLSLPFYFHQRNERRREVGINWTKDLRSLEPLLFAPALTYSKLYTATSAFPLDHYRRVLGPSDFRLLENFQNVLVEIEHPPATSTVADRAQALERAKKLHAELVNRGRHRSAQEYTELMARERRQESRRHPIHWARVGVKNYFIRRRRNKQGQD
ncbi:hypothetical protein [Microbacterium maritypicum]|uniref:Uncharacterized protein n=1 Tax=Microbacterium maritypicum MF109 TaxID=1333857 RepID=T5K3D7_MICMQ|nr:hypothetical protein [Microbacterium liquefaciens]EQM74371.1 hypothetical protein L687_02645 [Microbacterium maritypicum MF109]